MTGPPDGSRRGADRPGRRPGARHRGRHAARVLGRASRPGAYLQLDDVVALERALPDGETGRGLRRRRPGPGPPRGRALRLRRVPHRRRRAAGRGRARRRRCSHPVRARGVRAAAARAPRCAGRSGAERDRGAVLRRDGRAGCRPACRRDGEPLYLNLDFLDGTRGAHVNICGISGVATKTTYATFLLYGLFHSGVLGAEAANTKALIFNVKGEDLLFLDHAEHPRSTTSERERYARARARRPAPFPSVGVSTRRPARGDAERRRPTSRPAPLGVTPFFWTHRRVLRASELLPFLFADAEDERQQYTMVVHNVAARLQARRPAPSATTAPWRSTATTCARSDDLVDLIVRPRLDDDDDPRATWAGRGHRRGHGQRVRPPAAVGARAPRRASDPRRRRPTATHHRIDARRAQVTVVDLHNLNDRAKRFVVGVIAAQGVRRQGARRARHGRCCSSCSTS